MISNGRCVKKSKDKNGEEQVIYLLVEVLDFQLTSSFVPCGHSGPMTHTDKQGVEGGGTLSVTEKKKKKDYWCTIPVVGLEISRSVSLELKSWFQYLLFVKTYISQLCH